KIEELLPGARVEINPEKKDPRDFALWIKAEKSHIMKWNSPWSVGYPGWHIEDTAIALKYLGSQYDIHGGGIDLVFPHHEAEIAQAEATTGIKPYVKYWIHTGFLTIRGEKMAKSLGNFIVIFDLLEKYRAEAIRLYLSSTHFRKPLDFDEKELERAENRINDLANNLSTINDAIEDGGGSSDDIAFVYDLKNKFVEAMEDNMNTPLALQVLFKLFENLASRSSEITLKKLIEAKTEALKLSDIFQIVPKETTTLLSEDVLSILIEVRSKLRTMGNYQLADEIREKLRKIGIELEDTKSGTKWKLIRS
ncbi:MAG: class I tRNA ligase family protein, partial [Thermoproteota archaeon]